MMWWHGDWNGWAWLAMSVSMVAFWGMVCWVVVAIVRGVSRDDRSPADRDPQQILRERFARGEIDAEEYEHRSEVLRR